MRSVKRRIINALTAVSLVLFLGDAFLEWRSSIIRDEVTFSGQSRFVIAIDQGLIELTCSTCSVGTIVPIGTTAIGLTPGATTVYSNSLEIHWRSRRPGVDGRMTLHHPGFCDSTFYSYGTSVRGSDDEDCWPTPLVHQVSAMTVPNSVLLICFAVMPAAWAWSAWRRYQKVSVCPSCGHYFRGTAARCPACGAAVGAGA